MKIIRTISEMQQESLEHIRAQRSHGFVPTMGCLHEGHLSLIRRAAEECETVTVSIFVNPAQFNDEDDFNNYPRDPEADYAMAEEAGATTIFTPEADEIYSKNRQTVIMVPALSDHLCGLSRGRMHFNGVCQIVAKLFNIVRPDIAYFGQKDAQQALIIQRMVLDLNFPLKIAICPIVREEDGLAMSSRNRRLPEDKREEALSLSRALLHGKKLIESGETNSHTVLSEMAERILESGDIELDYLDIVSTETLDDVEKIDDLVMLAGAIKVADIRLIDNMLVHPDGDNA